MDKIRKLTVVLKKSRCPFFPKSHFKRVWGNRMIFIIKCKAGNCFLLLRSRSNM